MDIGSINDWLNTKATPARQQAGGTVKVDGPKVRLTDASVNADKAQEQSTASPERIQEAVSSIQEFVQSVRRDINFSLDDSSGRVVVKVTDTKSGDVIRQIPSEEALKLAESLSEARSLLFTAQV